MIRFIQILHEENGTVSQYATLSKRAQELLPYFSKFLWNISNDVHRVVLTNVKSFSSFESKLKRKGGRIEKVHDVLRGAILTQTNEEAKIIATSLIHNPMVKEWDHKNNSESYHNSWHFKILFSNMMSEIQIMTKTTWDFKELAHPLYNRMREGDNDKTVKNFSSHIYKMSDYV